MIRFNGEVAIVTGGASGIGAATCRRLIADGARVVVADINLEPAEALATELGDRATALQFDASDVASVERLVEMTVEQHGRLDILHNNAALTRSDIQVQDRTAPDVDFDIWDQIMAVNVRGYLAGCKFAIPHMIAGGGGAIVNTASDAGLAGDLANIGYGSSKGAVITLTKYVATQHGRQGIRCNAVAAGLILTEAVAAMPPMMVDLIKSHVVGTENGRPEDVANLVSFLASDEARFITGQIICIDGGLLAHSPQFADLLRMNA